ncbi:MULTISPECIES: 50S ribosomal protein L11 methyltransferase [Ligilactobacillus]|uniref:Ribosomal protein L11 methyltransferase n=1 Tax=Ligilactobacillus animalis TaxID=1605 RepID=A0AAJ6FZT4_9LACO|nr:50S ribosomal protein L11 methyltransferase [Ligilactobacillus animalis]KDA46110.1 ribosomal protein L11 methyltransferase, prmA [Ligilactobacillus animalis]MDO5883926.1 50S ribosomal protein L11 methyltransferase [Ligilactobacillus animalis]MDQ2233773.1 50S ribosomal protein L11 methyltransferase [Ligilactobacillus animalis]MDU1487983.1 50S ribosomal protein L11 methyltransferase [Ligilactobacillus animalis]MDU8987390.1 50S ribosomal protein L11 methyltransferase [Ligilactobacillus animali
MDWIKLTVTTTNEASEAVINLLMENGAGGVEIDDSDLSQVELATYFQAQAGLVELLPELEQKIAQLREFGLDPGKGTVKLAELDDDSWADVWKKYYHPVRLTRYLTIVPSWESYTPETTDEKVIKLDPGRAFGTGTHPTTKLALQALETVVRGGETMIDVGTGSGVLSIAAKYFGVAQIAAYDVDAEAVKVAEENLALNGMQDAITVGANDLLAGIKTKVGLITANILAEIIVPLIPQAYECLKPGGIFITSGIIADKKDLIVSEIEAKGFVIDQILNIKDWYSIIAHMPTTDEV